MSLNLFAGKNQSLGQNPVSEFSAETLGRVVVCLRAFGPRTAERGGLGSRNTAFVTGGPGEGRDFPKVTPFVIWEQDLRLSL